MDSGTLDADECHKILSGKSAIRDVNQMVEVEMEINSVNETAEICLSEAPLRLYVWTGFCPDYTDGLAFAIAPDETTARELITEHVSFDPYIWGALSIYPLDTPTEGRTATPITPYPDTASSGNVCFFISSTSISRMTLLGSGAIP